MSVYDFACCLGVSIFVAIFVVTMHYEYLIFNILIIAGPLAMSFEKKLHFVRQWKYVWAGIFLSMIPYIAWDSAVAHRHWYWNAQLITGPRLLRLPLEEWLFFITVPYACLFLREVLGLYVGNSVRRELEWVRVGLFALLPVGLLVFRTGREYTGLVMMALGAIAFLDRQIETNIFLQTRSYWYMAAVVLCTLIFNTYLTARPMLIYDKAYQLNFRIGTIPVEDFFYGLGHLILTAQCFDWLKMRYGSHEDAS